MRTMDFAAALSLAISALRVGNRLVKQTYDGVTLRSRHIYSCSSWRLYLVKIKKCYALKKSNFGVKNRIGILSSHS